MARPKNTDQRKEQIVDGLMTAMAEFGYGKATIAAIAKASGLASGLVHYHFPNKQAILLALMTRLAERLQERFDSRVNSESTDLERLDAFVDAYLALDDTADTRAVSCWVTIGAEAIRQPEVSDVHQDFVLKQQALLLSILDSMSIEPEPAKAISSTILATIEGFYLLSVTVPSVPPPGSAAGSAKAVIRGLLHNDLGTIPV